MTRQASRIAREGGTDAERQAFADRKAKVLSRIDNGDASTTPRNPLPTTLEEMRAWAALSNDDLDARIREVLSHASEYEPLDVRRYRQGVEDGIVAAFSEWQLTALNPTPLERADIGTGPPIARVYCLANNLGLDGAHVLERVAAAIREVEATTR